MKHYDNLISESIKKEILKYKSFITNPINTIDNPRMLQRVKTFDDITHYNIIRFCKYLNSELNIDLINKITLSDLLNQNLINYMLYLYNKHPTQSITIRTRIFPNMLKYFYKNPLSKEDEIKLKQLRKLPIYEGKQAIKKQELLTYNLSDIIKNIDNCNDIKIKLPLSILLYLGWRTSNIRNLTIHKNIFKRGNIWLYQFTPDEQKAPMKINGIYMSIVGKLPDNICNLLEDYIEQYPNNQLFKYNDFPFSQSWFNTYIRNACNKINIPKINPHSFRSLVAQNFVNATGEYHVAETWLWHKLKLSSSTYHYITPNYDLAVQKVGDYLRKLL